MIYFVAHLTLSTQTDNVYAMTIS